MSDLKASGTFPGRRAPMPTVNYQPPPDASGAALIDGEWTVSFTGDDGRSAVFTFTALPLPGWHDALAIAFAQYVGPAGTRRTRSSANGVWNAVQHFMRSIAATDAPPATPEHLTAAVSHAYLRRMRVQSGLRSYTSAINTLGALFRYAPLSERFSVAAIEPFRQRAPKSRLSRSGYSVGEFGRIVTAARGDVAAIRDRITAGEALLARYTEHPASLTADERQRGAVLARIADTGMVPKGEEIRSQQIEDWGAMSVDRTDLAGTLFVARADREALLVLLAAVTGRNSETLKELPAQHRIIDGRAVEMQIVKRRRGARHWFDTVVWEIGPPHRELHTPGGLYLLLHRLMARSRAFSDSQTLWSVWRNGFGDLRGSRSEHRDPFADRLEAGLELRRWSAKHTLRQDPARENDPGEPMSVQLPRIRTSVEVARTRSAGGHLPSAAKSNSTAVLFANYLRGDATAREWSEHIVSQAVIDAETTALNVHRSRLASTGPATLHVGTGHTAPPDSSGAWNDCSDPQHHPATGRTCRRASFLDCFHCGNALIDRAHLPAILSLLDSLDQRRVMLSEQSWWQRYGPVWAAIRHDVLPKFTPAEVHEADNHKPTRPVLELAEHPWERP